MRLKLDENFDLGLVPLVAEGGHEVDTVAGEGLSGKPDDAIYQACRSTGCVLVTWIWTSPTPSGSRRVIQREWWWSDHLDPYCL